MVIYYSPQVQNISQATRMNATLMQTAWCTEPTGLFSTIRNMCREHTAYYFAMTCTGNYYLYPETRSPACMCINNVYADFMLAILPNSTSLARVIEYIKVVIMTVLFVSTSFLITKFQKQAPWTNDSVAAGLIQSTYSLSNTIVLTTVKDSFATQTVNCLNQRATWRIYPNTYQIHPVILAFYTSFTLFLLGFTYMLRVEAPKDVGSWSKWLLLGFGAGAVVAMVILNVSGIFGRREDFHPRFSLTPKQKMQATSSTSSLLDVSQSISTHP